MTALGTQEKTTIKNAISEILDLLNIESGVTHIGNYAFSKLNYLWCARYWQKLFAK